MSLEVDIRHRQGGFTLEATFRAGGGVTALFGPSGAGKTTLVNAIGGLIRPERGRIAVGGELLLDTAAGLFVPAHRRGIGAVFQEGRLFPHLTVRQNLLFGRAFTRRGGRATDGLDLGEVVELLGIGPLLARRPAGLSGGEKQRVAIGRALLARPRLLLMDEPLASLDEARKAEILPALERLRLEARVPIVYVSHAVDEVARLATDIVILEAGRVLDAGPAANMLGRLGAGEPDDGTLLLGRIAAHDLCYALTEVATEAGDLTLPGIARAVGSAVRVRVRDVTLCTERPDGVGALNVLAGTLAGIGSGEGAFVKVSVRCGSGPPLLARLARRSLDALALAPGRPVFAIIGRVQWEDSDDAPVTPDERTGTRPRPPGQAE